VTDRPIIFSAPMIRALLEGRKTQTRRMLKCRKGVTLADFEQGEPHASGIGNWMRLDREKIQEPRFKAGDRLWVRENWRVGAWDEDDGCIAVDYCDGPRREWLEIPDDYDGEKFNRLWISTCDELSAKGIDTDKDGKYHWKPGASPCRWRPSIHMPRWASRLTLIVEGVKIERLQEISEADAVAEGIRETEAPAKDGMRHFGIDGPGGLPTARLAFFELWTAINGAESYRANPWVAAISFRVVKANIDVMKKEVP